MGDHNLSPLVEIGLFVSENLGKAAALTALQLKRLDRGEVLSVEHQDFFQDSYIHIHIHCKAFTRFLGVVQYLR